MNNVKEKIKKLLSLASSPNEHEAKSALLAAKKLMIKHKLSEEDLEEAENQQVVQHMCSDIKWTTDSGYVWMAAMADVICENYCCSGAWHTPRGRRTHELCIMGLEKDVQVCEAAMQYAYGFVNNAIKRHQRKYSGDPKTIANSYATGFIEGLKTAFQEQRNQHAEWALVEVKSEELQELERSLSSKTVASKKTAFDPLAYLKGMNDGEAFTTKKPIEGNVQ